MRHFNGLTVPKHLNLWIGDHASPEGAGLTIPLSVEPAQADVRPHVN
ncbi:hypothetical protein [Streptomyces sp. NPDC093600]